MAGPTEAPAPGPPEEDVELRRGGWRDLLRNRRYLLLLGSGSFAGAGYAVYSVSVLFLAYGLTGNLLVAGLVLFIEYGVYTATFLVAPLVDRARDKRTVLVICYPLQAAAAGALAWTLHTGTLTVPVLLALVFTLALLWDFVWAVFMVGPRLVLPKRQLYIADGFSSALSVGTQIGGYSGGGALLYFIGPAGGAAAYAVLLLLALALALPLSLALEAPTVPPVLESFRRGWDAFRGAAGRPLRQLASVETWYGFFVAAPPLLITAIAYERFPHPAAIYGVLVTLYAVGGAVAGIGIGHLNPRRSVGWLLVLTPLVSGLALLLLVPLSGVAIAAGALLALTGAAVSVRYTAKYAWVQGTFPPETLARMSANLYLFTGVAGTLAVLVIGSLSATWSLAALEAAAGAGLLGAAALAAAVPAIRRLKF
jgi:predicted MFS family arabinose efflux permease